MDHRACDVIRASSGKMSPMPGSASKPRAALLALLALACALGARPARAEDEAQLPPPPDGPAEGGAEPASGAAWSWRAAAVFAGGAATGFVAHEGGHLLANVALGNRPGLEPVRYMGAIPFFAIDPRISCYDGGGCWKHDGSRFGAGRRGLFLIESAGIQVQQYSDELILTLSPRLRFEDAPFRKGLLAFNTLLSVGYVLSSWAGTEPENGDLRALHRDTGVSRDALNALVLGVAVIDVVRYLKPEARWLAWVSRAAKVATTGLAFTI
jgi:hypothetical protein